MAGTLTLDPAATDAASPPVALPVLREDLQLLPGPDLADGAPSWHLHDTARNRFFRIGWSEFEMLQRWSLADAQQLIDRVNRETPLVITEEQLSALVRFLAGQQLILAETDEGVDQLVDSAARLRPRPLQFLMHRYLFFRIPLLRPDAFLSNTWPLVAPLFTRTFAWLVGMALLLGLYLVSRQWEGFMNSYLHMQTWNGLLLIGLAVLFAKLVHELGHAYACKKYHIRVPILGVAFLVMWPVLYTDTSEAWKLTDRRARLLIGGAGMLAELSLAIICSVLWAVWPDGPARSAFFLLAGTTWMLTLLVNLNPFMRFDGYYLLSDLLDMQNLQDRAFALGRWRLRKLLFGWKAAAPEAFPPRRQRLLLAYAWGTWLYRLLLFIGIALLVYHFFFKLAGILLMAVELGWFIARPLYTEMREWYRQRGEFHWNFSLLVTLTILATGLLLLAMPRQQILLLPATLHHAEVQTLYAPVGARIGEIRVLDGQQVDTGELLVQLQSTALSHQIKLKAQSVTIAEENLLRYSSSVEGLDGQRVALEALAKARSDRIAIQERIQQLALTSKIAGQVTNLAPDLHPGRWIDDTLPLLKITNTRMLSVEAYIDSRELAHFDSQAEATFYPDDPAITPLGLQHIETDPAASMQLHYPYLASTHGGPIGIREDPDTPLAPENSLYRVRYSSRGTDTSFTQVLNGKVRVRSKPYSHLQFVWHHVGAVLRRESGF